MSIESTLETIERRLAALEKAIASLTANNKGEHSDIDFSSIGGRLVRKAPEPDESPATDESPSAEELEAGFKRLGGILVLAPRPRE